MDTSEHATPSGADHCGRIVGQAGALTQLA